MDIETLVIKNMKNNIFTIDLSDALSYNLEQDDDSHTYGDYIDDYDTISIGDFSKHIDFCHRNYAVASEKVSQAGVESVGLHTLEMLNKS